MPSNTLSQVLLACLFIILTACNGENPSAEKEARLPLVVATTGMIADAVQQVAGEYVQVEGLMGPGVDPHLYKATRGDLVKLRDAKVIFYNGLHLEGKMGDVLKNLKEEKPVYAVGEAINPKDLIYHGENTDSKDPHIWFDVSKWTRVVKMIATKMADFDPTHREDYERNARTYIDQLRNLDQAVTDSIATIPEKQRVLITAHDAFSYFGQAYNIQVRGLQGISTISEFGLKDVADLVNFIVDRKIKAVFVESSIPTRSLEAVIAGCEQKGHEVKIGGTLYSDAMGAADTPEGTYIGMVAYNVNTIVKALK